MCTVSQKNIYWCWRYSSRRTKFSNILSICANKNGDKSAIWYWILRTLHRIHWRIVINACVKYQKKIFISVGDIHPDGQPRTDGQTDGKSPNCYPPQICFLGWGIIYKYDTKVVSFQDQIYIMDKYSLA